MTRSLLSTVFGHGWNPNGFETEGLEEKLNEAYSDRAVIVFAADRSTCMEWQIVPEENIKRFQKSVRYKRSEDKEAAIKKFKITFQKQRLWNEVLKIEKSADAQLGRSFEFALPKEWSRQEQIQYTADYIQKTFVDKGM